MLHILGGLGLGLVWGWLLVRLAQGARRMLVVRMWLWVAIQGLLVLWLGGPAMPLSFLAGLVLGALIVRAWLRGLAVHFGER